MDRLASGWVRTWHGYQLRQLTEVLGGCGEKEHIARTIRSSESGPIELENAFEMGEQHFNFLAWSSRGAGLPTSLRSGVHVTGGFINRSLYVPGRLLWTASGL
jgi:hypothetical protein